MAKKILSIDDSKSVHAYIDQVMSGSGFEFIHALSGKEGLEVIQKQGDSVSLILLDWEMPEITGPEVFEKLKAIGNKIPVIMVTSKNDSKDLEKMILSGVAEYVMKPFTPEILIEKIETVLTQQ